MKSILMKRLSKVINFILISFSLFLIIISSLVINDLSKLEPIKLKELKNINNKSYIYSDDLTVIKEINDDFKYYVTYDDLSDNFINALISIEDNNFFNHEGFDLKRIFSSLIKNIKEGKITQGASTLTQQLVKNITFDNSKNINRKIREIYLASARSITVIFRSDEEEQTLIFEGKPTVQRKKAFMKASRIGVDFVSYDTGNCISRPTVHFNVKCV